MCSRPGVSRMTTSSPERVAASTARAAIAIGHRYNIDSRDEGAAERNEIFRGEGSVFSCSYANECSDVCPKHVDPAAAVNQAKFNAVIDWATGLVLPRGGRE